MSAAFSCREDAQLPSAGEGSAPILALGILLRPGGGALPTGVEGQLSVSAQQEEEEGKAPRAFFADPFLGPKLPSMVLGTQQELNKCLWF